MTQQEERRLKYPTQSVGLWRHARAAQYAYYVLAEPFMPDSDFDLMEKFLKVVREIELPVGSDLDSDYAASEKALALFFIKSADEGTGMVMNDTVRKIMQDEIQNTPPIPNAV